MFLIRSPWATSTECELRHRKLFEGIGTSLQGNNFDFIHSSPRFPPVQVQYSIFVCIMIHLIDLGYIGYLLLYALTLYNIDEEKLIKWELADRDVKTIKMVGLFS